ncbi:MAG: bifunctional demethylmenaquinone methyltransferase/2-methoxy-6-polyprenyl-1,4-benzoquinol methylase UbiE [Planctomycetales bacterium]|nr:bifunctional demethylmenaquinone methyltransferase/2-methoxy-6-polyprenyl-1,4-benzoquinol methylase UbiE [Planctomycetales bacterium]
MTVDKSSDRVRSMFAEIAGRYDFLNHLLSMNTDRYWRFRTVRRVRPTDGGGPILDVCTGTGDLAVAYRRAAGQLVPVVGTDFCRPMLRGARDKAAPTAAGGSLSLVEADTLRLPFADDVFQIVSVAFGLRNVENTLAGLGEMTRVCRPGGRVAVLEFSLPTWQPLRGLYGWYFRHVLPRIGQALARNSHAAYNYLPSSVGEFPQGRQLTALMERAGLVETQYHPYTFGVATLYVGTKPDVRDTGDPSETAAAATA